jgi:predicted ATPase
MKDRGMQALVQMIRGKNSGKRDFLEALEKKYTIEEENNKKSQAKESAKTRYQKEVKSDIDW